MDEEYAAGAPSGYVGVDPEHLRVHEPDWSSLSTAVDEDPFLDAGVELLKSAGSVTLVIVSIVPDKPHARDASIRCGLLVRASKLALALVRDACRDDGVMQIAFSRMLIETLANLHYLCEDSTGERHQAFVLDSLVGEREFLENIRLRMARDGDEAWAIEQRMRNSIDRTAAAAGVDLTEVPPRKLIGWPGAQQRLERAYGLTAYPAYRAGSDALHGGWHDLFRNHLRQVPGGFTAELEPQPVRPQSLLTAAAALSQAAGAYLERRPADERRVLHPPLELVLDRSVRVMGMHEQFLARS